MYNKSKVEKRKKKGWYEKGKFEFRIVPGII